MTQDVKKYLAVGFVLGALAVLIGAFGAHALKPRISAHYLEVFNTGSKYHFIHAIGLVMSIFVLGNHSTLSQRRTVFILFFTGILLFSGSLYILSVADLIEIPQLKMMGAITPIGGLLLIAGWLYAAWILLLTS